MRFWRQWLLVGSIITYAGLCVVMVGFANAPTPGPAGPATPDTADLPAASDNTLVIEVNAPAPIKIKQGRM